MKTALFALVLIALVTLGVYLFITGRIANKRQPVAPPVTRTPHHRRGYAQQQRQITLAEIRKANPDRPDNVVKKNVDGTECVVATSQNGSVSVDCNFGGQ